MSTTTQHQIPEGCTVTTARTPYGWHLAQLQTPWGEFSGGGPTESAAVLSALRKSRREDGS